MKKVLVLGAGKSTPFLIHYLLENATKYGWHVTVADRDLELAQSRIKNHTCGNAAYFDCNDANMRRSFITKADVIVNLLIPAFQFPVAKDCVDLGKHMISVSYADRRLTGLEEKAKSKGISIITEIGLDPGIDHMSTAKILSDVRAKDGIVKSFESYGGGLPAMDSLNNPFKYIITWNPRNVTMAAENGAQFLKNGKIKILPFHNVFNHTWIINVEGIGPMEAYPNRDSLLYKDKYAFDQAETVIRGTLRFPGWSETWQQIIQLGLPNERLIIPDLDKYTYAQLTEMFLPQDSGSSLEQSVAAFLNISPTGIVMDKLRWLGLFSDKIIGSDVHTPAEALTHLLNKKLYCSEQMRDMVILVHELIVEYSSQKRKEKILSTMVHAGEKGGFTAMARTVGQPSAIVAKMLLNGDLSLPGCHIPTHPAIYGPALKELEEGGISFTERITEL